MISPAPAATAVATATAARASEPAGKTARHAVICGAGAWLPPRVLTNDDLAAHLETSDEWIRSRTGIAARHVADSGTATGDLATEAGALALKSAAESGVTEVDAVVLATTTPDRLCPATAPDVAARLGLPEVAAWDVSAVCAGFLYGLATASGVIASGDAERVLLIGAEVFTRILNPNDRTTAVIFGDGAGALVLRAGQAGEPGAVGPCVLGSDGASRDLISVPAGGSRQRTARDREDYYFQMRGREVYRHAVERLTDCSLAALARAGWRTGDVDRFAPHQANARICASVAKRLNITAERRLDNIDRVGNTAAASIPLLLAEAAADGRLRARDQVLIAGFGGGLTWGAATLVWPELTAFAECGHR